MRLLRLLFPLLLLVPVMPLHALVLNPGGYSFDQLPAVTPATMTDLNGSIIAQQSVAFSIRLQGGFTGYAGTLDNWVVRETATGTLDFYYQVSIGPIDPSIPAILLPPLPPSGKPLGLHPSTSGYDHFSTDLYRRSDLGGIAPGFPSRTADGDTLRVNYDYGVPNYNFGPGDSSQFFIRTDATSFGTGGTTQLPFILPDFDGITPLLAEPLTLTSFAPMPEPSTLLLLAAGIMAVFPTRRQRAQPSFRHAGNL